MSREAFEAALNKEIKGVGIDFSMEGDRYFVSEVHSAWQAWQAALAWAYEDAARVCLDMANERPRPGMGERSASSRNQRAAQCHDAIRERAKEVAR